jgi:hypothetical protein
MFPRCSAHFRGYPGGRVVGVRVPGGAGDVVQSYSKALELGILSLPMPVYMLWPSPSGCNVLLQLSVCRVSAIKLSI